MYFRHLNLIWRKSFAPSYTFSTQMVAKLIQSIQTILRKNIKTRFTEKNESVRKSYSVCIKQIQLSTKTI